MRRLRLLRTASNDLLDILEYVARESGDRRTAAAFVSRLQDECRKLARLPGTLGSARPEIRSDVRSLPVRGYIILFRYGDDTVDVLRIIEGHRDLPKLPIPP